jgi:hypothetical protein
MELLDQDPSKVAIDKTLLTRKDKQIYTKIPYERKDIPPALEPGVHKKRRYITESEAERLLTAEEKKKLLDEK